MRTIVFACVRNAGRSQMAAAFFNQLSPPGLRAVSAGTRPADEVHPEVVRAMAEMGVDLSGARPQALTAELAADAELLVTMGCGEECPVVSTPVRDWPLPDPGGQPMTVVRSVRQQILVRVGELLDELTSRPAPAPKNRTDAGRSGQEAGRLRDRAGTRARRTDDAPGRPAHRRGVREGWEPSPAESTLPAPAGNDAAENTGTASTGTTSTGTSAADAARAARAGTDSVDIGDQVWVPDADIPPPQSPDAWRRVDELGVWDRWTPVRSDASEEADDEGQAIGDQVWVPEVTSPSAPASRTHLPGRPAEQPVGERDEPAIGDQVWVPGVEDGDTPPDGRTSRSTASDRQEPLPNAIGDTPARSTGSHAETPSSDVTDRLDEASRQQLANMLDELLEDFDGVHAPETVRRCFDETLTRFADARIVESVPLLTQRFARERLEQLAQDDTPPETRRPGLVQRAGRAVRRRASDRRGRNASTDRPDDVFRSDEEPAPRPARDPATGLTADGDLGDWPSSGAGRSAEAAPPVGSRPPRRRRPVRPGSGVAAPSAADRARQDPGGDDARTEATDVTGAADAEVPPRTPPRVPLGKTERADVAAETAARRGRGATGAGLRPGVPAEETERADVAAETAARRSRSARAAEGTSTATRVPEVLFVCTHNPVALQMAASLMGHHAAGRVRVRTMGTVPVRRFDPAVAEIMREVGTRPGRTAPEPASVGSGRSADAVVTLGCGDECPVYPGRRYLDWDLPDPEGQGPEGARRVRDEADRLVRALLSDLLGRVGAGR